MPGSRDYAATTVLDRDQVPVQDRFLVQRWVPTIRSTSATFALISTLQGFGITLPPWVEVTIKLVELE
jgi:hypothetical protein